MSSNNRVDEAKKTAEEEKMKEHEERGNITLTPKAKEENEKKDDDDDEQTNVQYKHNIFRQRYGRTRRMRSLSWPPCLPNQQMLASTYTTVNNSEESDETPPGKYSVHFALFIIKYNKHDVFSSLSPLSKMSTR